MNERKNITQPSDWWAAYESQATKEGKSLSAWIGDRCKEGLPKAVQKRLSERQPAHRPKRKKSS